MNVLLKQFKLLVQFYIKNDNYKFNSTIQTVTLISKYNFISSVLSDSITIYLK